MNTIKSIFTLFFMKKSIILTIFILFLLSNAVMLAILGIVTTDKSSHILTGEITNYTSKVMEQAILNLDKSFKEVQYPLVMIASNETVLAFLHRYNTMSYEERVVRNREMLSLTSNIWFNPLISDILIIGNNGYSTNSSNVFMIWDYNYWVQPWYRKSISEDASNFMNLGLHKVDYYREPKPASKDITLSIGLPVKNANGTIIGSIICDFNIELLNEMLNMNGFEKSGYIFLTDNNGVILAHKDAQNIGKEFSMPEKPTILNNHSGSFISNTAESEHLIVYKTTNVAGWKLIASIPVGEINEHSNGLKKNITQIFFLFLVIDIILFFIIALLLSAPFNKLLSSINNIKADNLTIRPSNYTFWELNIIGKKFEELVERIDNLIKQNYQSQIHLKEAELSILQSQINPHMLYNTLQMLQTEIVTGNIQGSNNLLLSLSNLFRYSIHTGDEIVPISQEIKYIKNYLYICSKKFDGSLSVFYDIPKEIYRYKIQKLLLQPIVENCIVHGFEEAPVNGEIHISAQIKQNGILFSIRDNGAGIRQDRLEKLIKYINAQSSRQSKVGLRNVNQRVKIKFGDEYGISIESQRGQYTVVHLLIAKQEGGRSYETAGS